MTLYRAAPRDGVAWITGASTGIGRHLALDLARQGYRVAATARDPEGLASLEREAAAQGLGIAAFPCDVRDEAAMERTVAAIESMMGPVVLAVLNAGVYSPTYGERLEAHSFATIFSINVVGVVNALVPVADRMRDRGFGQIALVGSVTAYFGLPATAAYGGSKAALNAIAQSLRYDFDKLNIRLQIINPGFVETPLTAAVHFPMPALMPAGEASRRIAAGLASGGFEIAFPRRLVWPMKALALLPAGLVHRLMYAGTGWGKRRFGRRKG